MSTDTAVIGAPSVERRRRAGDLVNTFGLVGVFIGIVVLFSILKSDTFPTTTNAQTIMSTQAVLALLALAAMVPLVTGHFDVSVGFQLSLSQTLCAGLAMNEGWPVAIAAVAAVAACLVVGGVNALLITRLRLSSFVATLAVGTLVLGLTQLYGQDAVISGTFPSAFIDLGQREVLGIPLPFMYVLVAAGALWVALEYTSWGRQAHATGGNERAALLAGVRTDRAIVHSFLLAGLLSGLAGVLSVSILGSSSPTVGLGSLLPAFAAAFLGATAIRPGRFNSAGTILAIYLLAAGITGLQMLGAKSYVSQLFYGGALLIALSLSALVARARGRADVV
ncbi:MAG: hypothetical protein JWQ20_18 [Conexibacter sp.]|jgi:ribose transport system permease protein|nr:hypothetical protein [Conexibacter sp.]